MQLSSGIYVTGKDKSEDFHDDEKMKLSNELDQYGEEEREMELHCGKRCGKHRTTSIIKECILCFPAIT